MSKLAFTLQVGYSLCVSVSACGCVYARLLPTHSG